VIDPAALQTALMALTICGAVRSGEAIAYLIEENQLQRR